MIARMTRIGVGAALDLEPLPPRRADAVLAGDRAAERERGPVQVGLDRVGLRLGLRVAAVEHEIGVQVAVAGVPERPDPDVVLRGDALDLAEHVGHARSGHADVLHPDVAQPLQGVVSGPPRLAQPIGLLRIGRPDHVRRARHPAGGLGALELVGRRDAGHVRLDHEHRGRGPIEAQVVHVVDRGDGEPVQQLEGHRRQPRRGDPGDRLARRSRGSGRRPASSSAAAAPGEA